MTKLTTSEADDARYHMDALKTMARAEKAHYKKSLLFAAANWIGTLLPREVQCATCGGSHPPGCCAQDGHGG